MQKVWLALAASVVAAPASAAPKQAARAVPKGALALEVFRNPVTRQTRLTKIERKRLWGPGFASTWNRIGGAVLSQARSVGGSKFIAVPGRTGVAIFQLTNVGEGRRQTSASGFGPGGSVTAQYPLSIGEVPFGLLNIGSQTSDFVVFAPPRIKSIVFGGHKIRSVDGAFFGSFPTRNAEDVFGVVRAAL